MWFTRLKCNSARGYYDQAAFGGPDCLLAHFLAWHWHCVFAKILLNCFLFCNSVLCFAALLPQFLLQYAQPEGDYSQVACPWQRFCTAPIEIMCEEVCERTFAAILLTAGRNARATSFPLSCPRESLESDIWPSGRTKLFISASKDVDCRVIRIELPLGRSVLKQPYLLLSCRRFPPSSASPNSLRERTGHNFNFGKNNWDWKP